MQVADLESGRILRTVAMLEQPQTTDQTEGRALSLAFTPDGHPLSAGWGGVREWDLTEGSFEWLHRVGFAGISFSRDHRYLLVRGRDDGINILPAEELVLYDLETGGSREITTHGHGVRCVALDLTGQIMATGSEDGAVRIGRVDREVPHLLLGHDGAVYAIGFSPDGEWLASEADDGIRVWRVPDLHRTPFHILPHDELLARLDSYTNWRVVPDESSSTGWKVDMGPFSGWEEVPEW